MWEKLLEVNSLLLTFGFGTIGSILIAIFKKVSKSRKETEAHAKKARDETEIRLKNLEFANVALLHDKIYQQCTVFLNEGWISVDDLENLDYLWRGYHNLGGNGTGEILYNKVKALPNKDWRDQGYQTEEGK